MSAARAVLIALLLLLTGPVAAADHAVVLMYHHVAEDTPPSTSVLPATFERHLDYLAANGFRVWPLSRILRRLHAGEPVPEDTVAITFDDAYRSVYTEAFPRLRARGWPFTVFVPTDPVDAGSPAHTSWDQLRTMARHGAEIGNHTRGHPHLVRRRSGKDEAAWEKRVRAEIVGAQRRIKAETGAAAVPLLAYPYGEYDAPLRALVAELGLFGVGQHSGPAGGDNPQAIPRFPVAHGFDDLASLAEKLRTRPLPAEMAAPASRILDPGRDRPTLRLRLREGPYRPAAVTCYASGQGRIPAAWHPAAGILSVTARAPLPPGRSRYNCTAPVAGDPGAYFWYSHLWLKKRPDGHWYRE